MGIFNAIGRIFGGSKNNTATDPKIAIKGDISPIPPNLITPEYRPQNGVYISTSADILREWESKGWMISKDDLETLKAMHKTLEGYEKLSQEYGKELGAFSKTEAKLVKTVTGTIPKVAGANFAQYSHNQKLNSNMDGIAAEYQKNIALRQAEAQKIQQQLSQFRAKMQQRKADLRGG
ncbi:hypothetical protein [Planktothrix paucivesiculata]|uniref:Uncharacterized protein n=1 Tax=Planktothrix paucivesiculata PCC 9631 TaxID=671071 RepID=A0A7Z9E1Q4_9CYAN|nr:hypothetical protein [Planktothrix paucivesiculata]VXD18440.1 hypothetical protein PL9631_40004 [Planktothrix paucivesiculata PCC 9631]